MDKEKSNEIASFSERLKEGMKLREKRQVDLCRDLNMNKSTVSGYMSGAHVPDSIVIGQIAKYLRVDPAWLTGFNVSPEGSMTFSSEEIELIIAFRNADEVSREAVKRMLAYTEKIYTTTHKEGR